LRRRRELALDLDIFEVKLGEHHLMSSLFTASEIALAEQGIAEAGGGPLDVIVGGLGLGYTAQAVLACDNIRTLAVIELMQPVIEWHVEGLLPMGTALPDDERCTLVHGDFFAMAASRQGYDAASPGRQYHAILLDIDHSPDQFLDQDNESFYQPPGLEKLQQHLLPGGVFGLWSDALPQAAFVEQLLLVFPEARAIPVTFHNPLQRREFTQTVYIARKADD